MQRKGPRTVISKSALVPYSATSMYELVADVERYPDFLPWCSAATLAPHGEHQVDACMDVARGPLRQRFSTRNTMHPHERVELRLLDGPFRSLEGDWRFGALGEDGSRVSLELSFEFSTPLLRRLLDPLFSEMANSMVSAFCRRADEIYGGR